MVLCCGSRAGVMQIMNLLLLAPDLQVEILYLAPVLEGSDPIHLEDLKALTAILCLSSVGCGGIS